MALRWRGLELLGFLLATAAGCSDDGSPAAAGHAGMPAAGDGNSSAGLSASGGTSSGSGGGAGTAGSAGVPATGGVAGTPSAGGAAALGGSGGAAGAGRAPAAWTCNLIAYGDGTCDCGCGAPDADCTAAALDQCETCNGFGSCSRTACPGRIDPDDVATCLAPPAAWLCTPSAYGDGTCDCGCGVVDVDCADATSASCAVCDGSSCSPFSCTVNPNDNAHCPGPPPTWTCPPRLYQDGSRCDCGCGSVDPDCATAGADACDKCDAPGSCSAQPCPGYIDAASNNLCDQPPAPAGWTCSSGAYADGLACDCGCGVPDPDCRAGDATSCVRCLNCGGHGSCEGTVDTDDTTQCAPPPSDWLCSPEAYRDLICDCGCGIPDAYCQGIELFYVCGNYPVEGCTAGLKTHIDPNHNAVCRINIPSAWTCDRAFYDDGLCDCGCGAVDDLDCASSDVSECETCNDTGSCSTAACPGSIVTDDTAHCSN